mgnify:FL=1
MRSLKTGIYYSELRVMLLVKGKNKHENWGHRINKPGYVSLKNRGLSEKVKLHHQL